MQLYDLKLVIERMLCGQTVPQHEDGEVVILYCYE